MLRRCVWSRNIKNGCFIYIYICDISRLKVNDLTLILLSWRKWWAPNNVSKQQMGFNSAFKGLITSNLSFCHILYVHTVSFSGRLQCLNIMILVHNGFLSWIYKVVFVVVGGGGAEQFCGTFNLTEVCKTVKQEFSLKEYFYMHFLTSRKQWISCHFPLNKVVSLWHWQPIPIWWRG